MLFATHLVERGLIYQTKLMADCWIDWENEVVTFPLGTPTGIFTGYQQYKWNKDKTKNNDPKDGRYYTYIIESYRPLGIFGFDRFNYHDNKVFIVEGIWDAIRIRNAGYNVLAILGATPHKALKGYLKMFLRDCLTIGICDNGDPKQKIHTLTDFSSNVPQEFKDLGEMPQFTVDKFLKELIMSVERKLQCTKI